METATSSTRQALLFIPDISGFTRFIGDRDFQHGQHIMAELLEVLIEANQIDLNVNEVEGDAVFFYRLGDMPDIKDLIAQSERMYFAFHNHLKKYGVSRLCNCPTCMSASRLTLKFVAHYGNVSFHKVKEYEKLFGTDVILVHRLLKNDIIDEEYLLVTDSIPAHDARHAGSTDLSWEPGSQRYDLGEVKYSYSSLAKWYEHVPEPEMPEVTIHRSDNPLIHAIEIDAPVELVYDTLIDLNQRKNYMVGMKSLEIKEQELNRMNRICTTFKCSMEHDKCTFETSGVEFGDTRVSFSETFKEQPMTFDYVLERQEKNTRVSINVHLALRFPMNWIFNVIMKRKLISEINQTLLNLKRYCEKKQPPV